MDSDPTELSVVEVTLQTLDIWDSSTSKTSNTVSTQPSKRIRLSGNQKMLKSGFKKSASKQICPSRINLGVLYRLHYGSIKDTIDWCIKRNVIPSQVKCCVCKENMKLTVRKDIGDNFQWRCRDKTHDMARSIRKGSLFGICNMKISLALLLTYMWLYDLKNYVIECELSLSFRTVANWIDICRDICTKMLVLEPIKLGGPDIIVHIAVISQKEDTGDDKPKKTFIFGGVEKTSNKCFFEIVEEATKPVFVDIVKKYILSGTTVISYCYDKLECFSDDRFKQHCLNNQLKFVKPGRQSNIVGCLWSQMKRKIGDIKAEELQSYMGEYMWRRNYKNNTEDFFENFLRTSSIVCSSEEFAESYNKAKTQFRQIESGSELQEKDIVQNNIT